MIKNLIIIGLLVMIITGVSTSEAFTHIQQGLDFLKDLLYNVERSVEKIWKTVLILSILDAVGPGPFPSLVAEMMFWNLKIFPTL